jgi:C4-dicarboxylate-specific signal transduction histidine kinase
MELAHVTRVTALGELGASVAHEVGQPLAAIVTSGDACLRWLDREAPQLDEVRACVQLMKSEGTRASEIVLRIRSLTKRTTPQTTRLELNDLVNDVVSLVQREVFDHQVLLRLNLAPELPALLGDRVQLQQVIINLIINGIQAMAGTRDRPRELLIRCRTPARGLIRRTLIGCSTPSSPLRPMAWAWDCRSAVRSSKPTEDACGRPAMLAMVRFFSAACLRSESA